MAVFVDTSGIFAVLDADDRYHRVASEDWLALTERRELLVTSNYVLVEATALTGRRLGVDAVRALHADMVPIIRVTWVDEAIHNRALAALLTTGDRHLSLVDCVSFEVMRSLGVQIAFAFDRHFTERGFQRVS